MDKHGFLPTHCCKVCGNKLEGEMSGHPAELYAGTYVVRTELSGAKSMSHAPHCPSWRRDREMYYWFDDCKHCQKGKVHVFQALSRGGSYYIQCQICSVKHYCGSVRYWDERFGPL